MNKIYGFVNGGGGEWLEGLSIGDDGSILGGHVSSSEFWAEHDLGPSFKKASFDARYPDGWEYEYVPIASIPRHAGLQAAIENCKAKRSGVPE